jgi:hypothetical protein
VNRTPFMRQTPLRHETCFCRHCSQNVYNLSALTRDAAEDLINEHEGRLCVRYFTCPDKTIVTAAADSSDSANNNASASVITVDNRALHKTRTGPRDEGESRRT